MRDKPDQMSGFKGSLPPEEIYLRFVEALRLAAPTAFQQVSADLEGKAKSTSRKQSLWDSVVSKERGKTTGLEEKEPQMSTFAFGFLIDDDENLDI